jgi:hypothetical protein
MFPFHYPGLQCLACYWGWSCQFVLIDSAVGLPYLLDLFLMMMIIIIIIIAVEAVMFAFLEHYIQMLLTLNVLD